MNMRQIQKMNKEPQKQNLKKMQSEKEFIQKN